MNKQVVIVRRIAPHRRFAADGRPASLAAVDDHEALFRVGLGLDRTEQTAAGVGTVARQNIETNGVGDRIRVREGNLLDQAEGAQCDICVANIIADIVLGFAVPLKAHIRPDGLFICSGIILERQEEVRKALLDAGYEILSAPVTPEWAAFCARRPK